ncbi:MAG: tetratricopeptide repeat protein [Candidatus Moranbacteria bacterium]|nr:tetratricopeptide repeat protein [Candidatus Moranbacteria bacterium]
MLYYTIPPVVIIIGLAVLIWFLFRKASQIPPREITQQTGARLEGLRRVGKAKAKISELSLRTGERMTQWSKLLSLKFYNLTHRWFQSIRKRRQQSAEKSKTFFEEREETTKIVSEESKIISPSEKAKEREIKSYPMISKEIVRPETRSGERNMLETALIERIAANPQDIEAYERLGDYYLESGNNEDALECFRQVLKLSPVHRKAKIKVVKLKRMLGK